MNDKFTKKIIVVVSNPFGMLNPKIATRLNGAKANSPNNTESTSKCTF